MSAMGEYKLVTVWSIDAPLEAVYGAICDPLQWPQWWPDARRIEQRQVGTADGVGRVLRCTWQGHLPYRLSFDLLTTRIQPLVAVEGDVEGDLEGYGRCSFAQTGAITIVRHEWRVCTTRCWMNLLAPILQPLFKHNHALAMKRGGEGLAQKLQARLVSFEHSDIDIASVPGSDTWLVAVMAAAAGLVAGALATAFQIALWWLCAVPVAETLYRDTRLTAAVVMGVRVLSASLPLQWSVILVATLLHFALSVVYGVTLVYFIRHLRTVRALVAGGCFGMALYAINLYGFTTLFPWFAVTRDWITAFTHLAFGVILAGCYLRLRSYLMPPTTHHS